MRQIFGISLGLALTLAAIPGWTQGAEAEPDARALLAKAQVHVDEASRLYLAADYEGALAALKQAEPLAEKAKDPSLANIRFNIARCYEQLKRWPEALSAYESYNALPDEAHRKERAWAATQKLRTKVYATLSVTCFPAGARLEIPGVTKGAVGCPWQSAEVKPGNYLVSVRHPGYAESEKEIIVTAGQAQNVEVGLEALAPAPGAGGGVSTVAEPPSEPVNIIPWLVIGGGAVVLGTGGLFTSFAVGDREDAEELAPTPERADEVSSFERNRTLSYVMYGTGAGLVAAGIALFFFTGGDADETPADATRVVPTADGFKVVF